MLTGEADGPVAVLALLQSPTPTGVQYATMVPAYQDALRRDTFVYLRLGYSLDAGRCISDYWWDQNQIQGPGFEPAVTLPWDLLFERQSATARRLTPPGSHAIRADRAKDRRAVRSGCDAPLPAGLSYTSDTIDMSDRSPNLVTGTALGNSTLATRTGLGRFAKLCLSSVITRDADTDLVFEVFVYRQSNWDWTANRAEPGVREVMALCIDNVLTPNKPTASPQSWR